MSTWSSLAGLRLSLETVELLPRSLRVSPQFDRRTTVVRFEGGGAQGLGEDVVYDSAEQQRFQQAQIDWPKGEFDLAGFSERLDRVECFERPPQQDAYRDYRRWALESAALDLALCQAETTLAEQLELSPRPIRFVASMGLGQPPTTDRLQSLIRQVPGLRFKLDANSEWSADLLGLLAELNVIDVVDLKGAYKGTPVDSAPDAALYRRVAELLPDAVLEDPAWTEETAEALEPYHERISWDAPIHSVGDIEALPFAPRVLNIKPSRFGSLEALCEALDYCKLQRITMYGGGQFELDVGRLQIQTLSSLFHPEGPNDVSPVTYHDADDRTELEGSPLEPLAPGSSSSSGFGLSWP
jgi:hypothetical protein